jgi:hypothetical protein
LENLLALIETSALGGAIRSSVWIYPTVNVLHVLGVMTLFAAVAAMDVRILCDGPAGARAFVARIRPWAVAALVLMLVTGFLLFVPEATHIGSNPVFRIKLAAIALALLNVGILEAVLRSGTVDAPITGAAKGTALASLLLWLCVAALGRLIAYF